MPVIQNNSLLGDATGTTSTQGTTTTFPAADPAQPDPIYGWSDYIRQQKESCNTREGCEWDDANERCNCLGTKDSPATPGPCDTASCPEGYTCKENPDNPAGYDCISDAVYAETLEGYLDTVNLGGFCQGATQDITERGQAGCETAGGTWVDYEDFFGPNYYKKIAETFGFGEDDYSEFFPEFPFEAFEDVLPKLPEYAGQQQALINRAFGVATADRKRRQATIDQAYKDGLISIDQHEELLKSAFALQAVTYQQQIGTEKYKARINQAYDEGHISEEERDQLLSALGNYEGTFKSDMDRKLAVALEEKKRGLGNVQRQFTTSVSELRGSLLGALPGISEALGTEFAGSGYAKTMEQRVYEQSQDAFSNIVANIYIPDFENIQSKYNLTTGQIREETQEAMDYAYLKFLGDEQSADASEQAIIERSNSIRLRKQEADAGLLTDAEKDQLARDEASLNLRDEMDKRISEVDSILYDWLNQTIKQAGIVAEGIEEPSDDDDGDDEVIGRRTTESCEGQCAQTVDGTPQWESKGYNSLDECTKGCTDGDDGFVTTPHYSCVDNECVPDAEGYYTSDDCDGDCEPGITTYSCNAGVCEKDANGQYESLDACRAADCEQVDEPYDCIDDVCVPHTDENTSPQYVNLSECEAGCGKEEDKCADWCGQRPSDPTDKAAHYSWMKTKPLGCNATDCGEVTPQETCEDRCGPEPTVEGVCEEMGDSAGCEEVYKKRKAEWDECCDQTVTSPGAPDVPVTTMPSPPSARYGANFITSGPQNIMVGDNPGGRELVQVTPLGSPNTKGPKSFLDQLYKNKMNYSFNQNSILEDLYR